MSQHFSWTEVRNCRRFFKRYYTLSHAIDQDLVDGMTCFGFPEITRFSQYAPEAFDTFKVKMDDDMELSGSIKSHDFYVTVSRQSPDILEEIEGLLAEWSASRSQEAA
jgi:hypothetical protein